MFFTMLNKVRQKVQTTFITGFLTVIPLIITIVLISFLFNIFDNYLNTPFSALFKLIGLPQLIGYHLPGFIGLLFLILFTFFIGLIVKNVIGKKIFVVVERILSKLPLIWNIYHSSKQILEAISNSNKTAFKQVVLIEYPRRGIYTIGFLSSDTKGEIQSIIDKKLVNVFLPTTPNPTSGFLLMVPEDDIIPLSMNIEAGIKLVVSGGMVAPPVRKHLE
ncbi:MAG: DUF502 domain-containing protein [bacterium]